MCLAVPAEVMKIIDSDHALINLSGVKKQISTALLNETLDVGDYVIVHVGFALTKLDEVEAKKTLALLQQALPKEEKPNEIYQ